MSARLDSLGTTAVQAIRAEVNLLYLQHQSHIGNVAMKILGDRAMAEDVVQETFVSAYLAFRQLKDGAKARPWLTTIAVRQARKTLWKRKALGFVGLGKTPDYKQIAPGASAEEKAMLRSVYRHLDKLPPEERVAWTLRHFAGEQLQTISDLSECSLATTKRRINSAAKKLQKWMSK